jgi:hypothetical protein
MQRVIAGVVCAAFALALAGLASSPEELSRTMRDQFDRYGKLFKQAGIKAD